MRFNFLHRRSKTAPGTEKHAWAFGAKAGYWPCHKGPFLTIEFATHRFDMWYGTPSTESPKAKREQKKQDEINRAGCPHNVPYRYSCEICDYEGGPEEGLERHLSGWARGNLQFHLIWVHNISPADVPYDGPLDEIHRKAHAND